MFVKAVDVEGFRSYGNQVHFGPFSQQQNAIVGMNGCGKSNFYKSIEFVLLDEYSSLGQAQRKAILHEGNGQKAQQALVSITFDNTKRSIPVDADDVIISRKITMKKDEFFVNNKKTQRTEVRGMLEAAGFSSTNSYAIVRQNRVALLASLSDKERYNTIDDVAGTKYFDEQLKESLLLMEKSDQKCQQIDENLDHIKERLSSLETEIEEQHKYEEALDRSSALSTEEKRRKAQTIIDDLNEAQSRYDKIQEQLTDAQIKADDTKSEQLSAEEELRKIKSEVAFRVSDLETKKEKQTAALEAKSKAQSAFEIAENSYHEAINRKKSLEERLVKAIVECEQNISSLENLREEYLEKAMKVADKEGMLEASTMNEEEIKESIIKLENFINSDKIVDSENVDELKSEIDEIQNQLRKLNDELNGMKEKKKELDEKKSQIKTAIGTLKRQRDSEINDYQRAKASYDSSLPFATLKGIQSVKDMDGVLGTIADLVKVPDDLYMAAEAVGMNKLFFVVTESQAAATKAIRYLCEKGKGSITAIPIDSVKPLPKVNHSILDFLEYPKEIAKAAQYVFGGARLCETTEEAVATSRSEKVTCVSKDGTLAHHDGYVCGGSFKNLHCKLINEVQMTEKMVNEVEERLSDFVNEEKENFVAIEAIEEEIVSKSTEIMELQRKLKEKMNELSSKEDELKRAENDRWALRKQRDEASIRLSKMKAALKSPKTKVSTQKIEKEIEIERKSVEVSRKRYIDQETLVKDKLEPMKEKLSSDLDHIDEMKLEYKLSKLNSEFKDANSMFELATSEYSRAFDELTAIKERQSDIESLIMRKTESLKILKGQISDLTSEAAKAASDANEARSKIGDFGNNEKVTGFEGLTDSELRKMIRQTTEAVKKYRSANTRAEEQHVEFTAELQSVGKQRESLSQGAAAIRNMIAELEQRRIEARTRIFESVSSEFAEISSQLLGGGAKGHLEVDHSQRIAAIVVTLNSSGLPMALSQLSGGQRSLIALALIFALQRASPAPFYLLDEVDAALDPVHRAAVANLLRSQAEGAQYLVTTFGRELLRVSNTAFVLGFTRSGTVCHEATVEEAEECVMQS